MNKRWFFTHLLPILLAVFLVGGGVVYAVPSLRNKATQIAKETVGTMADVIQTPPKDEREPVSFCADPNRPQDKRIVNYDNFSGVANLNINFSGPRVISFDQISDNTTFNFSIKTANNDMAPNGSASPNYFCFPNQLEISAPSVLKSISESGFQESGQRKDLIGPDCSGNIQYKVLSQDQLIEDKRNNANTNQGLSSSSSALVKSSFSVRPDNTYLEDPFVRIAFDLYYGPLGMDLGSTERTVALSKDKNNKDIAETTIDLKTINIPTKKEIPGMPVVLDYDKDKIKIEPPYPDGNYLMEIDKETGMSPLYPAGTYYQSHPEKIGQPVKLVNLATSGFSYRAQFSEPGEYEIKFKPYDECGAAEEKTVRIKVLEQDLISFDYEIERAEIKPADLDVKKEVAERTKKEKANVQINLYFGDKLKFYVILKNKSQEEFNTKNEPVEITIPDFYRVESVSDGGEIIGGVSDEQGRPFNQKIIWKNILVPTANLETKGPGEKRLEIVLEPKLKKEAGKGVLDSYQKSGEKINQEIKEKSDTEVKEFETYVNDLGQAWIDFIEKQNFVDEKDRQKTIEQINNDQKDFLKRLKEKYTAIKRGEEESYKKTQEIIGNFNKKTEKEEWVSEKDLRDTFNALRIEDQKRHQNLQKNLIIIDDNWGGYLNWLTGELEKIKKTKNEFEKDSLSYQTLLNKINEAKKKSFDLMFVVSSLIGQENYLATSAFSGLYSQRLGEKELKINYGGELTKAKLNLSATVSPTLELKSFTHDGKTKVSPQWPDKFLPGDILEFSVNLKNDLPDEKPLEDFYLKLKLSDGLEISEGPKDLSWHYEVLAPGDKLSQNFEVKIKDSVSLDINEIIIQPYTEFDDGTKLQIAAYQPYDLHSIVKGKIIGPYERVLPFASIVLRNVKDEIISGLDVGSPNFFDYKKIVTTNENGEFEFLYNRKDLEDVSKAKYEVYYKNILWDKPQFEYLNFGDKLLSFKTEPFELKVGKDSRQDILINRCSPSPAWEYPKEKEDKNLYLLTYNASKSYHYLALAWQFAQDKIKISKENGNENGVFDFAQSLLNDGIKVKYETLGEETTDYFGYKDKTIHVNKDSNPDWLNYKPHSELHEFGHYLDWLINDLNLRYVKVRETGQFDLNAVNRLGGFINDYSDDSLVEGLADWFAVYLYNELEKNDLNQWDYRVYHNDGVAEYALNSLSSAMVGLYQGHTMLRQDSEIKAVAMALNALTIGPKENIEISGNDYKLTPWINTESFSQPMILKIQRIDRDGVKSLFKILKDNKPYTMKELFDAYKNKKLFQNITNELGLTALDQVYLLYGFFVDHIDPEKKIANWQYDYGEEIGRAANAEEFSAKVRYFSWMNESWMSKIFEGIIQPRPKRHNKAVFPGSNLLTKSSDVKEETISPNTYHVEVKFKNPVFNYDYDTISDSDSYDYIAPPPVGSQVEISNTDGQNIMNIDSRNYFEALDSELFEYMAAPDDVQDGNSSSPNQIDQNDSQLSTCVISNNQADPNQNEIVMKSDNQSCRSDLTNLYQGDTFNIKLSLTNPTSQTLTNFTLSNKLNYSQAIYDINPNDGIKEESFDPATSQGLAKVSWNIMELKPGDTIIKEFSIKITNDRYDTLNLTSLITKNGIEKLGQAKTQYIGHTSQPNLELLSLKRDGQTLESNALANNQVNPGDQLNFKLSLDNLGVRSALGSELIVTFPKEFKLLTNEIHRNLIENQNSDDLVKLNLPSELAAYGFKVENITDENQNQLNKIEKLFTLEIPFDAPNQQSLNEVSNQIENNLNQANPELLNEINDPNTENNIISDQVKNEVQNIGNQGFNPSFQVRSFVSFNSHVIQGNDITYQVNINQEWQDEITNNIIDNGINNIQEDQSQLAPQGIVDVTIYIAKSAYEVAKDTLNNIFQTVKSWIIVDDQVTNPESSLQDNSNMNVNLDDFLNNFQGFFSNLGDSIKSFFIGPTDQPTSYLGIPLVFAADSQVVVGPTISVSETTPSPVKAPTTLVIDCKGFDKSKKITVYLDNKEYKQSPIISKNFGIKVEVPKNAMLGTHTIKVVGENSQEATTKFKVNQNSWWNKLTVGIGLALIIALIILITLIILNKKRRKVAQVI